MLARNIRHLPVVDEEGALLGMVSLRDVLNVRVDQLQRETALLRTPSWNTTADAADRE